MLTSRNESLPETVTRRLDGAVPDGRDVRGDVHDATVGGAVGLEEGADRVPPDLPSSAGADAQGIAAPGFDEDGLRLEDGTGGCLRHRWLRTLLAWDAPCLESEVAKPAGSGARRPTGQVTTDERASLESRTGSVAEPFSWCGKHRSRSRDCSPACGPPQWTLRGTVTWPAMTPVPSRGAANTDRASGPALVALGPGVHCEDRAHLAGGVLSSPVPASSGRSGPPGGRPG